MRTLAFVPVTFWLASAALAQMAGTYTINPALPASGTNFASLLDATTALAAQGVSGPVDLQLFDDAGPFATPMPFVTATSFAPNTAVLVLADWPGVSNVNRVTFRAAPGERPVFDAAGKSMGVFWNGADFVTLQGIEIKNALHDAVSLYSEAIHTIPNDAIIDGCRLHDCGGTGVTIYGNTAIPANATVRNCVFYRLQLAPGGGQPAVRFAYVNTRRSTGTRLQHNTFIAETGAHSTFAVIGAFPSNSSEVVYAEISNNIIVKSGMPTHPMLRIQSPAGTTNLPTLSDSNCWFDTSGGPFAVWGPSASTVSATLGSWQGVAARDLASLASNPSFVDAANRDYHLQAVSACVGASTVATATARDFDGQTRAGAVDIGADEFSAATKVAVGVGCSSPGGSVPVLDTDWPFLGNANFAMYTTSVAPGQFVLPFGSVGVSPFPLPLGFGCSVFLDLATAINMGLGIAGPGGSTSLLFPLPASPALAGFPLAFQSVVLDPASSLSFVLSNAVSLTLAF
jgi:hypothetical protein